MKDIQFKEEKEAFNIRVTGVVVKEGKILLNCFRRDGFWQFVGGKLTFGESTREAVIREYREETGADLKVKYLSSIAENFFSYEGRHWHELLYFYVLEDPKDELEVFDGTREVKDNAEGELRWFSLGELDGITMQPACSTDMIHGINSGKVDIIVNRNPQH